MLLLFDAYILLNAFLNERSSPERPFLPTLLFFCSGMPALIYQIVWQRALFAIYGVNSESVAVVVSAFMLGLGVGSLLGGWLSTKYPCHAILFFGAAELSVAVFGLFSLRMFNWAAGHTAGAPLPAVVVLSLTLLLLPTVCMGATLPLLANHLIRASKAVGYSVGILYFANTFGSAFACFLCAKFLMRDFGQSGSVRIAVSVNVLVAATALLIGRSNTYSSPSSYAEVSAANSHTPCLSFRIASLLAGSVGFVSLGFEIIWFRVFVLASQDRAAAFALLLSTFLAGVAAGAFVAGQLTQQTSASATLNVIANLLFAAAAISGFLTPLVAWLAGNGLDFLVAVPAFFLVAGMLGAVFTLVCKVVVPAGAGAGHGVSLIYVSNIIGSATGSFLVGFVFMNYLGLLGVTTLLAAAAFVVGTVAFLSVHDLARRVDFSVIAIPATSFLALAIAPTFYSHVHERLVFRSEWSNVDALSHLVENRNGIIAVMANGAVVANSVFDGYFNIDPADDKNLIIRAYAIGAFHPEPRRILLIGLSSGSWAQVLVNHPVVESLEIVEINPGYLKIIPQYPAVRSILQNPKIRIHIDDGRRWLLAHPDARYNVIVQNTSFYWRDHSTELLSADYLRIIQRHLEQGGIYYYNTTGSDDVIATGLAVFPYGLRIVNFLAVSDSPISVDKQHWASILRSYSIEGRTIFDPNSPATSALFTKYMAFADSVSRPHVYFGMEDSNSMRARLKNSLIITDDNMGWEWRDILP
jgi:hypothetical protein